MKEVRKGNSKRLIRNLRKQSECEHEEVMQQGDGSVYGYCKKCLKELY